MEKTILAERNNTKTLKNVKAHYTGKAAKLLDLSKRTEIEKMLIERQSTLKQSKTVPTVVLLKNDE